MRDSQGINVGREITTAPLRYYVILPADVADDARPDSVRSLLETRLGELKAQADLVRTVLDTLDPGRAERFLFDAVDLAVSQVVLRAHADETAIADFTQQRFGREATSDEPASRKGRGPRLADAALSCRASPPGNYCTDRAR